MSLRNAALTCRAATVVVCLALMFAVPALIAQDAPVPKVEAFGGYSWYHPGNGIVNNTSRFADMPKGFDLAATINMGRYLGLTFDGGAHFARTVNTQQFLVGPQIKLHSNQVSPFVHVMMGLQHIAPVGLRSANSIAVAAGGGLDVEAGRRWGIRLFQADYIYSQYNPQLPASKTTRLDGVRLQGGLTFKFGVPPEQGPVSATCTGNPATINAGEPVTVTITPTGFLPKRILSYEWTATGGKAAGTATTTTVDTTGLAPGNYTVTGKVTDNGKAKNQQTTSCNANFSVNEPPKHPPTISCSAGAQTVRAGDPVTFTCQSTSPDNRPLTYNWTSSAGRLAGNGLTGTLDTAGASAGPINVTNTVSDDRGMTATGNASVNVEVPPPPPTASKINSINFPDTKKPARVDNAAKAALDDVALRLQREADAKAVVVGYGADTKKAKNLAAQRAVNTKAYLVTEKGIDPSRIEVRSGTGTEDKADIYIVPTGASFTEEGTTVIDESKTKAQATKAPARRTPKKKAAAAPAQ